MFGKKKLNPGTIDCLIGAGTVIRGDVHFKGGLRIDGEVRGNVLAEEDEPSMLVLSENARIEGRVRAAHLVVNGTIVGPVQADDLLELQPKAQVSGEIRYRAIEMHHGAVLDGALAHLEEARRDLKLAASNE